MSGFKVGDVVKVVSNPYYTFSGEEHFDNDVKVGSIYTVTAEADEDGDVELGYDDIMLSENCLELIEDESVCDEENECPCDEGRDVKFCPEDEEGPVPDISAGRLVVKVELRFFIRDLDVTERIKGLVA